MSGQDKEIPEELFRKDFGGSEFEKRREERRSEKIVELTANGLLIAVLGPAVLAAIAVVIAVIYYCKWGTTCGF